MDGTAQGWGMDSLGEWWRHGGVMSWSSSWLTFIMFVDVNSLEKGWEHVAEKTSQFTVLKSEKCWYPMISAFCRSYPYVWFETKPWVMIWDHAWNLVMSGGKPSHYRLPSYDPLLAMMICGSHEISSACIYIYILYIYIHIICTIWLFDIAMENPLYMRVLTGKSSINGPFSMTMLNNQRVYIYI